MGTQCTLFYIFLLLLDIHNNIDRDMLHSRRVYIYTYNDSNNNNKTTFNVDYGKNVRDL